ncbi:Acg family FMN-binding oxidoreductase [Streptomyces sp. NPDC018833]|uniref:Acg family FMN-binding oxidoreductase n=1 Tax=Streptomyces sp. NPDC018833 TaxID=3365053 RepID=UPI00378D2C6E
MASLIGDAVAAPSLHNAQPWRFRYFKESRTFHVLADRGRAVPHVDPQGRALHISCGAALLNLRASAARAGWDAKAMLLPAPADADLLATVQLLFPLQADEGLARLYPAINSRHTSRFPFEETDIPPAVQSALQEAAASEGARLQFLSSAHLDTVLELVEEGESLDLWDSGVQEDLARWTRTDAQAEATGEGIPQYAFGPRKRSGRAALRDFAGHGTVADRDTADFETSPNLALLSTAEDRPTEWVRAGQALERVLLLATLEGLSSSFATQPVERSELRWALRDPVHGVGAVQMVLRLGYGPPGHATPRRPVWEVLDIGV